MKCQVCGREEIYYLDPQGEEASRISYGMLIQPLTKDHERNSNKTLGCKLSSPCTHNPLTRKATHNTILNSGKSKICLNNSWRYDIPSLSS